MHCLGLADWLNLWAWRAFSRGPYRATKPHFHSAATRMVHQITALHHMHQTSLTSHRVALRSLLEFNAYHFLMFWKPHYGHNGTCQPLFVKPNCAFEYGLQPLRCRVQNFNSTKGYIYIFFLGLEEPASSIFSSFFYGSYSLSAQQELVMGGIVLFYFILFFLTLI